MNTEYITNQCFKSAIFVNQYNNRELSLDAKFSTQRKEAALCAASFLWGFD